MKKNCKYLTRIKKNVIEFDYKLKKINGIEYTFKIVKPYKYTFSSFVKESWLNKSLLEISLSIYLIPKDILLKIHDQKKVLINNILLYVLSKKNISYYYK